jgi:hypothetical protein
VDRETQLREALRDVSPVLERHRFKLRGIRSGSGSGGPYAVATYRRGLWRAYIYYRDGIEPGWYRHAWYEVSHSSLVPVAERRSTTSPFDYARQLEKHAVMVLSGDWPAFWRAARRAQRDYRDSFESAG